MYVVIEFSSRSPGLNVAYENLPGSVSGLAPHKRYGATWNDSWRRTGPPHPQFANAPLGRSDVQQKQRDQGGRENCKARCQAPERHDQRLVRKDAHVIIPPVPDGLYRFRACGGEKPA